MSNANKILFTFETESINGKNSTLTDKAKTFEKLRERDLDPMLVLNGESAFDEHGVMTHELVGDDEKRALGHATLDSVGAMVNRLNRSFYLKEKLSKKGDRMLPALPDTWQAASKPTANENAMRSLSWRKDRMYDEVLEPMSLGIPTALVRHPYDVALFTADNPSQKYIVKPNSGSNNQNINSVTADEAIAMFESDGQTDEMIIQPKYDFTGKLHPDIKPFDAASNDAFEAWNQDGIVKELRVYAFLSPGSIRMFSVARAFEGRTTNWFFIDPETVPQEVYDDTESIVRRSAEITRSIAMIAANDVGYGMSNTGEVGYSTVEANGRMPHIIGYHQHAVVADKLRDHYADMLRDTVDSQ